MKDFGFRAWLLRLPMPPRSRGRLLRLFGATVGRNVRVHPLTVIDPGWKNLTIGGDVYIGHDCILDLSAPLVIEPGAVIAAGVAVATHQDAGASHGSPTARRLGTWTRPITIGAWAFIGTRALIFADVGEMAVVGAGAVVVRPVEEGDTVVGVPARSTVETR